MIFTARCTIVQSAVLRSHVVCPSVTLVDCDHIGWNSSKIISRAVSLGCSLFATQTSRNYSKGTPRNFRRNRGGLREKWLSACKSRDMSETRQDRTKVTRPILRSNRKTYTRFRLVPKSMTLDDLWVIMHSVSKHVRLTEFTVKI